MSDKPLGRFELPPLSYAYTQRGTRLHAYIKRGRTLCGVHPRFQVTNPAATDLSSNFCQHCQDCLNAGAAGFAVVSSTEVA